LPQQQCLTHLTYIAFQFHISVTHITAMRDVSYLRYGLPHATMLFSLTRDDDPTGLLASYPRPPQLAGTSALAPTTQLVGFVLIIYGICLHSAIYTMAAVSLILVGHMRGWSKVSNVLQGNEGNSPSNGLVRLLSGGAR